MCGAELGISQRCGVHQNNCEVGKLDLVKTQHMTIYQTICWYGVSIVSGAEQIRWTNSILYSDKHSRLYFCCICQNQRTLQTIDKQIQLATISLAILYLLLCLEYHVHSLARPSPGIPVPSSTPGEARLSICLDDTCTCTSRQMSRCLIIRGAASSSAHIPSFSLTLAQLAQIPWNGDDLFLTVFCILTEASAISLFQHTHYLQLATYSSLLFVQRPSCLVFNKLTQILTLSSKTVNFAKSSNKKKKTTFHSIYSSQHTHTLGYFFFFQTLQLVS